MPNRWAVANGNWSSTATWNSGGSLGIPTGSDDVFTNTFTVNMDQSISVLSLRNTTAAGVSAGGSFNFNSGSISASLVGGIADGGANLIQVTATTGTVNISAPNATVGGSTGNQVILHSGACDFIITASVFSGPGTGVNAIVFNKTSTGTLFLRGNVVGSTVTNTQNLVNIQSSAGNTIITGNITGGIASQSQRYRAIVQTAGALTIIGNLTGGNGTFNTENYAVDFSGTALTITGSIIGGSGTAAAAAINITSTPTVNISGSITAATNVGIQAATATTTTIIGNIAGSSAASGIVYTGASFLSVSGSCTAGSVAPAVVSTSTAATNIFTGPFTNTNDTMAVQCVDMVLTQDASTTWNFGNATLFSPERLAFYPSASDIRQGVTYADGTVSGSLAMPPPTAVIAGTPTDNTTGSAVLTSTQLQNAFWGAPLSQMTNTGSIGARLAKSATTDSTGNQLASYLI